VQHDHHREFALRVSRRDHEHRHALDGPVGLLLAGERPLGIGEPGAGGADALLHVGRHFRPVEQLEERRLRFLRRQRLCGDVGGESGRAGEEEEQAEAHGEAP
jgi:hypothetical protein